MFRNTGANAFAKNQTRLAYEDKRDLYCSLPDMTGSVLRNEPPGRNGGSDPTQSPRPSYGHCDSPSTGSGGTAVWTVRIDIGWTDFASLV